MCHLEKIYFSRLKRILTQKPHKGQQIWALTYGNFGRLKVYHLELCFYFSMTHIRSTISQSQGKGRGLRILIFNTFILMPS